MYEPIRSKLEKREAVILDGPMGSELVRRGVRWRKHGLLTDTDKVSQLHDEYLAAGADVLRTNTFQLNPRIYLNVFRNRQHMGHIGAPGLDTLTPKLLRTSVQLAKKARAKAKKDNNVAIAGVLSPLEHCFRPDLAPKPDQARREHEDQAKVFADEKVDFLLLESMNTIGEMKAALAAAKAVGLPVWVSFLLGPEGELLSREPLKQAVKEAEAGGAEVILVNCAPAADITRAVSVLGKSTSRPFGAFAHVGRFSPPSWKFEFFPQFVDAEECPPDRYAGEARQWREAGASVIGACCGAGPAHIAALRSALANGRSPR